MSTETKPISASEYKHWKETALLDGDLIDRFAATIDSLFANNADLLAALKAIYRVAEPAMLPGPVYLSIEEVYAARDAIAQAEEEK